MQLTTPQKNYSTRELRGLYYQMAKIRIAEEQIAELLNNREINCPTHLYTGQEAIAVGICFPLRSTDYVFGNHRSHGHYLAKGGNLKAMMAELSGKKPVVLTGKVDQCILLTNRQEFWVQYQ